MRWSGKLIHVDIGPGQWALEVGAGSPMPLLGAVPSELAGQKVVVKGRRVEGMGIAMTGSAAAIEVESVTRSG